MKFRDALSSITLYEAGKPIELVVREFGIDARDVIKLASNENPFGASPKVQEKIASLAGQMHRYPDDSYHQLKAALAEKYAVTAENIVIGSGSDQIFELISHALLSEGDTVLQNRITFAMYDVYTRQRGAQTFTTATDRHDLKAFESLLEKQPKQPKLIYLCTPSNPLGDALDADDVFQFLEKVSPETLVVIDGAYMEYAAFKDPKKLIEPKKLIAQFPNAVYAGTFSKAYGLGGMRVGYGFGEPSVIAALHKMRAPFNITTLSLAAAIEALNDQPFVAKTLDHTRREMARYEAFAQQLNLEYIDSYTNFIALLFPSGKQASDMANALLREGVIVRDLKSYGLNALRITIGQTDENSRFFERFKANWR